MRRHMFWKRDVVYIYCKKRISLFVKHILLRVPLQRISWYYSQLVVTLLIFISIVNLLTRCEESVCICLKTKVICFTYHGSDWKIMSPLRHGTETNDEYFWRRGETIVNKNCSLFADKGKNFGLYKLG